MTLIDRTALELGRLFEQGKADPREVTDAFIARAKEEDAESRVYVHVLEERARMEAEAAAERARHGLRRHALDGVPISWKDLFDTAGAPTAAGTPPLRNRIPTRDALVLERATRLGSVCLGKTTMTELAFSGLGINPSFGTPANPHDEHIERVPGGSSSGAGVSVARGMAAGAIGTDTGGSVRIPAAWNGLVGLKTTEGRLPLTGTLPLSRTFDTIGPLARNVEDAAAILALLEGKQARPIEAFDLTHAVFLLPGGIVWSDLDDGIAAALDATIRRILHAGARIVERSLPELEEMQELTWGPNSSRIVADAYAEWGDMLREHPQDIYAPVRARVMAGELLSARDIIRADRKRADIRARYRAATAGADAVLLPSVAITPPPIATLESGGDAYGQANRMALRNATLGNQLGLCAITLPSGYDAHGIPVGLMLQSHPYTEEKLLSISRAIEKLN